MWRAGLHIREALALTEGDLDRRRGSVLVRRGEGGPRREVDMDAWGLGTTAVVARAPARAAGRSAAVRDQRRDARTALVARCGSGRAASHRRRGRRTASLCAT
jgi:hypothetical protein